MKTDPIWSRSGSRSSRSAPRRSGSHSPAGDDGRGPRRGDELPPLPADIKSRNRLIIGVKCDVPPFGYIDVQGQERRLRRRDRTLVRALRVRTREPRLVRLRTDGSA